MRKRCDTMSFVLLAELVRERLPMSSILTCCQDYFHHTRLSELSDALKRFMSEQVAHHRRVGSAVCPCCHVMLTCFIRTLDRQLLSHWEELLGLFD
jgi:hypothetical protein